MTQVPLMPCQVGSGRAAAIHTSQPGTLKRHAVGARTGRRKRSLKIPGIIT